MTLGKYLIGLSFSLLGSLMAAVGEGPHCKEADRLIRDFARRVEEERGLTLTGFGGEMHHEIRTLGLSFCVKEPLEIEDARTLYLEIMEEFIEEVNRDRQIRPYLAEYPISTRQVELLLSLQDNNGKMRRDGSVCMILNVPEVNKMLYHKFDADRVVNNKTEFLDEAFAARKD